jgi:hypothetical protein
MKIRVTIINNLDDYVFSPAFSEDKEVYNVYKWTKTVIPFMYRLCWKYSGDEEYINKRMKHNVDENFELDTKKREHNYSLTENSLTFR